MSELKDLQKLVCELENEKDEKWQVKKLQEIGISLINEYEIHVGNRIIKPLLVEAYYYHEGKFEDASVHSAEKSQANTYKLARERQKNHFSQLYIHYGRSGLDIVLSQKNDYYLSFLLKCSLVGGDCMTQTSLPKQLCDSCDRANECKKGWECKFYGSVVLKKTKNPKTQETVCVPRKNTSKGTFSMAPLAVLSISSLIYQPVVQSLDLGHMKQWVLAKYALEKAKNNIEDARKLIKQQGLYKDKIDDRYMESAKKYIEEQEK